MAQFHTSSDGTVDANKPGPHTRHEQVSTAPDGSAMTPSMVKANADFDADVRAGNITKDGVILKDKSGNPLNNPRK